MFLLGVTALAAIPFVPGRAVEHSLVHSSSSQGYVERAYSNMPGLRTEDARRRNNTDPGTLLPGAFSEVSMETTSVSPAQKHNAPSMAFLSQFGIRWTFDQGLSLERTADMYQCGQFANGDFWIVGPVTIIGIDPPSTKVDGRVMNGSMINPVPGRFQGYDSAAPGWDEALNVALDISERNPLIIQPNSSLVSASSIESAGARPQLKTAAVLTVLASPPSLGSFRPPYCGGDKSVRHHVRVLDYSQLRNRDPVPDIMAMTTVADYFERPWLDHGSGLTGRYIHPTENMPDYGREIHTRIGVGALRLHVSASDSEKEALLVRYVQLGIDLYGIVKAGGNRHWTNEGANAGGRKWPILFAGIMLGDTAMRSIGRVSGDYLYTDGFGPGNPPPDYVHFGEDDQTFYVSDADLLACNSPGWSPNVRDLQRIPYTSQDIGLAEWGIRHSTHPAESNRWWGTAYRQIACPPFHGTALAALLMGAKYLWNHNAYFDYTARYMRMTALDGEFPGHRSASAFTEQMWDIYYADLRATPPQGEADDTAVPVEEVIIHVEQTEGPRQRNRVKEKESGQPMLLEDSPPESLHKAAPASEESPNSVGQTQPEPVELWSSLRKRLEQAIAQLTSLDSDPVLLAQYNELLEEIVRKEANDPQNRDIISLIRCQNDVERAVARVQSLRLDEKVRRLQMRVNDANRSIWLLVTVLVIESIIIITIIKPIVCRILRRKFPLSS